MSFSGAGPAMVAHPADTMDVHVKSALGGTVTVCCLKSCSSEGLRIAVADQFGVDPGAIELTARGFSTDSIDGLAAVRSGCTVNLMPATRAGLDTTLHSRGRSRAINPEEICGLLEALESAGDKLNARVHIVFSGDDGSVGETHLDASEAASFIKASLAGDPDADIAMETLLSRAGDTTGCASFDTDLAALSPTPPTPADPESDCEAGTDDVPDRAALPGSGSPSPPSGSAIDFVCMHTDSTREDRKGCTNKRKSDDQRGSVGESPDDVTDASSRSLAERRARRLQECHAKTKEIETRKMENQRMNRTLEIIAEKKRAKAAKRARRLGLLKAKTGSSSAIGTPTGAPIGKATLAPVPLGVQVPVAAEVKHGFGGFQKGFLC